MNISKIPSIILIILTVLLAVLAVSPNDWLRNLQEWKSVLFIGISFVWTSIFGIIIGLLFGRYAFPGKHKSSFNKPETMTESEFSDKLHAAMRDKKLRRIDVWAYTTETVNEIIKYDDKNLDGLNIRVLIRNWHEEKLDEDSYNVIKSKLSGRKWSKSDAIKALEGESWRYQSRRDVRLYWGYHPLLKLIIAHFSGDEVIGFVSFYDWMPLPSNGGSPFKGSSRTGFFMTSSNSSTNIILDYLQHQFEFVWKHKSDAPGTVSDHGYKSVFSEGNKL